MKMKKIASLILAGCMVLAASAPALAAEESVVRFDFASVERLPISYKPFSDHITTPSEQDQHERELSLLCPNFYKMAGISGFTILSNEMTGALRIEDPGEGAVRISTGNLFGLGTIYWDAEEKGPNLGAIASIYLSIRGGKKETVLSIIMSALDLLGIPGEPNMSCAGEAKRGHSVAYINKAGEFYHNKTWETAVLVQQRHFFEHTYSVSTVGGVAKQLAVDKTPENGFSAYLIENKPNFNNNTFISNKTLDAYTAQKQTGVYTPYYEKWF